MFAIGPGAIDDDTPMHHDIVAADDDGVDCLVIGREVCDPLVQAAFAVEAWQFLDVAPQFTEDGDQVAVWHSSDSAVFG